ncbi:DUF11 domain-containing protein, partial [Bacillus cereus]|nr:DUF11 domain-containing protein [Bacillus cereus]
MGLNTIIAGENSAIGVFTSIDTTLQVPGYPPGTTNNFALNSSSAILNIPPDSVIEYAELVWAGSCRSGTQDVIPFINNNISFSTPLGTFSIAPDPATAQENIIPPNTASATSEYVRSANVTSLVQAALGGTYTVGNVPGVITTPLNQDRSLGWILYVSYSNPTENLRNLNIYTALELVAINNPPVTAAITGFTTPSTGPINGRLMMSVIAGDSEFPGDTVEFGPTLSSFSLLFGPNNPINNFFCSQINNPLGLLDTTGTFGNLNQPIGGNTPSVRQGLDTTGIDVSPNLVNNQTEAFIRFSTAGDQYTLESLALQIDLSSPIIQVNKSVDKTVANIGDTLNYTIEVQNIGDIDALNNIFTDSIPNGTTFSPNSLTINGVPQPEANPALGVNLGTISPAGLTTVTFQVIVTTTPVPNPIPNQAIINFTYQPVPGLIISETEESNIVTTQINNATLTSVKTVSQVIADIGDT